MSMARPNVRTYSAKFTYAGALPRGLQRFCQMRSLADKPPSSRAAVGRSGPCGDGIVELLLDLVTSGILPVLHQLVVVAHRVARQHDVVDAIGKGLLCLFARGGRARWGVIAQCDVGYGNLRIDD